MNIVRESIKPVVKNSRHVAINHKSLDTFINSIRLDKIEHWFKASPFKLDELTLKERLAYAFVLDSISFSYWGDPKWTIEYKGEKYDGAKAMMACIGRAIENGVPLLDPKYLSIIGERTLERILGGNVEIPLFYERLKILQEVGRKTGEYGGYEKIIDASGYDAEELAKAIVKFFPSFEDSTIYNDKGVFFYKRAQLLAADISYLMEGTHQMCSLEKLTACADYKIPQVLAKLDVFRYSEDLARGIAGKTEFNPESEEVIEIRSNCIYVVDLIADRLGVAPKKVNDHLWLLGQDKQYCDKHYFRARTTAF